MLHAPLSAPIEERNRPPVCWLRERRCLHGRAKRHCETSSCVPEVEIVLTEFHSDEGVEALRAGRLDVCVVYPPRNVDPALLVEPIMIDPLVVALPKGHVLAKSRQISLRRLRGSHGYSAPRNRFTSL